MVPGWERQSKNNFDPLDIFMILCRSEDLVLDTQPLVSPVEPTRPMNRRITHGCEDYRQLNAVHRRGFFKLGTVGSLGLTLPGILRHESRAAGTVPTRAKNVILFWLQGGISHHETLDPKPHAPAEVRGEFDTIPTTPPGVRFSDFLPRLAGLTDKLAVIRSVTHSESSHQRGSVYMAEGRRPAGSTGIGHSGNPLLGSIIAHELGMRRHNSSSYRGAPACGIH